MGNIINIEVVERCRWKKLSLTDLFKADLWENVRLAVLSSTTSGAEECKDGSNFASARVLKLKNTSRVQSSLLIPICSSLPIDSMSRRPEKEVSVSRTYTTTNSTRNPILCITCTLSTSTPPLFSSVFVMSVSTDNLVLSLKGSPFPIGPKLLNIKVGKLTLTPELLGKMPCTISSPNGLPCNSW